MTPDCSTASPRPHGANAKERVTIIRNDRRMDHLEEADANRGLLAYCYFHGKQKTGQIGR